MLNELEYWLVDDKYRGQGIGKTLYEKMVDDCSTMDIKNMSVMFKKDNMKLCNLYSSLGYEFVSTYDGVDTQKCMNGQTDHNKWYRIEFREFIVPYKKDYRIIVLVKD
jgi:L-amino acid N-acyltransferase YncA